MTNHPPLPAKPREDLQRLRELLKDAWLQGSLDMAKRNRGMRDENYWPRMNADIDKILDLAALEKS